MKKFIPLVSAAAIASLVLSACSSSGSGSGGSSTPTASTGSSATASSATTSSCVSSANAAVAKLKAPPALFVPSGTLQGATAKGKSVYVLNVVSNDFTKNITNGIHAAATALGMSFKELDGTGTAQSDNQILTSALNNNAGAVIMNGINPAIVSGPLAQANSRKIPVVTIVDNDVNIQNKGVYADITLSANDTGVAFADYALSATSCGLHMGNIGLPASFALNHSIEQDTTKEVNRLCSSCSVDTIELDLANLATATPTAVQSLLKKNPKINALTVGFDAAVTFVGPAATAIKSGVKLISVDGLTPNLAMIKSGGPQTADMALPPNEYIGWLAMDSIVGGLTGAPAANRQLPMRLIDSTNVADTNLMTLFPAYANFVAAFKKRWGI